MTTYIDPQKFNYAFANTRLDAQNFMIQIGAALKSEPKRKEKKRKKDFIIYPLRLSCIILVQS